MNLLLYTIDYGSAKKKTGEQRLWWTEAKRIENSGTLTAAARRTAVSFSAQPSLMTTSVRFWPVVLFLLIVRFVIVLTLHAAVSFHIKFLFLILVRLHSSSAACLTEQMILTHVLVLILLLLPRLPSM